MRFSSGAVATVVAVSSPLLINGFVPTSTSFTRGSSSLSRSSTATTSVTAKFGPSNKSHSHGCSCPSCASSRSMHSSTCNCPACIRVCKCPSCTTRLFMSEEASAVAETTTAETTTAETTTEEVPAEVEALDGIADETEAHNTERPARGSGLHKHQKRKERGTPIADLEIGSTVEGKVKTITTYGAFLDIGASTDALLHVSRLSDDFVSNVEDIVKAGDVVSVRIINVDTEKRQVAVSMRSEEAEAKAEAARSQGGDGKRRQRPRRSDGDRAAQRESLKNLAASSYSDEQMVEGEVVSTLDFGAFVRFDTSQLAEGLTGEVDGLVHISGLTAGRASSVESVVKPGDKVQIRVKNVDSEGGKVSLSMITKEQEAAMPQRGPKKRKGGFTEAEMGPKDWKEQLERVLADQPQFKNAPVVVDNRK